MAGDIFDASVKITVPFIKFKEDVIITEVGKPTDAMTYEEFRKLFDIKNHRVDKAFFYEDMMKPGVYKITTNDDKVILMYVDGVMPVVIKWYSCFSNGTIARNFTTIEEFVKYKDCERVCNLPINE